MTVIFDGRWNGEHGIGRFSKEVRRRLPRGTLDIYGTNPVSPAGLLNLERQASGYQRSGRIFFSPGFTPPVLWRGPLVFTVHDLIHLDVPEESSRFKSLYYQNIVRSSVHRAKAVLTVSEYSKQRLLEWSGVASERVHIVGNGVDEVFSPKGEKYKPGYPYIFYVRNSKPHKNVLGLLKAFALLDTSEVRLLLSGQADENTYHAVHELGLLDRVIFTGRIPDAQLPAYYRGATVVTMPSLYEGFGLPALEGMASGVPVVVSDLTSLPEVVGDAGILINPRSPESLAYGLTRALHDSELREQSIQRGLDQAQRFKWDKVVDRVNNALGVKNI